MPAPQHLELRVNVAVVGADADPGMAQRHGTCAVQSWLLSRQDEGKGLWAVPGPAQREGLCGAESGRPGATGTRKSAGLAGQDRTMIIVRQACGQAEACMAALGLGTA